MTSERNGTETSLTPPPRTEWKHVGNCCLVPSTVAYIHLVCHILRNAVQVIKICLHTSFWNTDHQPQRRADDISLKCRQKQGLGCCHPLQKLITLADMSFELYRNPLLINTDQVHLLGLFHCSTYLQQVHISLCSCEQRQHVPSVKSCTWRTLSVCFPYSYLWNCILFSFSTSWLLSLAIKLNDKVVTNMTYSWQLLGVV